MTEILVSAGSILGSVLGGRWSDRTRREHQEKNNGVSKSEVSYSSGHI
jgi:hypothetical protein